MEDSEIRVDIRTSAQSCFHHLKRCFWVTTSLHLGHIEPRDREKPRDRE